MIMKLAAVTVLYNPEELHFQNLQTYATVVEKVFVVDNSDSPSIMLKRQLESISNIHLISNNENKGVATALNEGIRQAIKEGYNWILTMDQDSSWEEAQLKKYIEGLYSLPNAEHVAVVGITYNTEEISTTQAIKSVNTVITSGSIVNAAAFEEIGGYLDKLFIDEVDHEYCYRALTKGYNILLFEHIFLQHNLGKAIKVKDLSGKKELQRNLHAPFRLYYMVRNGRYVIKKYGKKFPEDMQVRKRDILVRIKNSILYSPHKTRSLRYVILGLYHFGKNRFGKL